MRGPREIAVILVLAACARGRDGSGDPGADSQGPDVQGEGEQSADEPEESGEGEQSDGEPGEHGGGETESTGGETGEADCDDAWEPNPSADQPSMVIWQSADEWAANHQIDDAGLCAGEHDWYHFDVESLGFDEHYLYVRALVKDAGLCGASCDQPVIPAGPQHAMTVEIYRANDVQLLATQTDDDGVLVLNGPGGEAYARDVLIHVFSPTVGAEYPYRLLVSMRNYDGEDECEC
jgi:hypothetical protein